MKRISTLLAFLGLTLCLGLNANAQNTQMVYSYHHPDEPITMWGTKKHEN